MRKFSLSNPEHDIAPAVVGVFKWGVLDAEIGNQLGFEEQYLQFHRYLLENIQSVPQEQPHYNPRPISLSLRAGMVKAYVVFACSILEGVLASWGAALEISARPERLHKMPFGALLKEWCNDGETPRPEIADIWGELNLLLEYRNFIHFSRAAENENAYWKNVLEREQELLRAVDTSIEHLSNYCGL